jgi:hypothetical protein
MTSAIKYDQDKLPMHLIDRTAIEQVAAVLQHGANKYSSENWRNGIEYNRLIAATLRHVFALNDCEDYDPESGLPHAAHAMCCLMFLLWMMRCRPDLDDRWRGGDPSASVKITTPKPDVIDDTLEEEIKAMAAKLSPANFTVVSVSDSEQ